MPSTCFCIASKIAGLTAGRTFSAHRSRTFLICSRSKNEYASATQSRVRAFTHAWSWREVDPAGYGADRFGYIVARRLILPYRNYPYIAVEKASSKQWKLWRTRAKWRQKCQETAAPPTLRRPRDQKRYVGRDRSC